MSLIAKWLRRIGGTGLFRRIAPFLAGPVDRALHRATGGRITVSQYVAPLLFLHHIGRRTAREHRTPLFYARLPHGWVVVATNFGRAQHPSWSHNLLQRPEARIEVSGEWHDVEARLATAAEWDEAWPQFVAYWPAYDVYLDRTSQRDVRMFVLEPTGTSRRSAEELD